MNFIIFLPLILAVIVGIIAWSMIVQFKFYTATQLNNTVVPFAIPNKPLLIPKISPSNECAHDGNQTLDSGILCTPHDLSLIKRYNPSFSNDTA